MADADTTLFVWLNGLTGAVGLFDSAARVVGSDYAVPAAMGLTILATWFAGGDAEDRMRRQVGVFVALTAIAFAAWIVFAGNELYFRPRPFDAALDHDVTVLLYRPTDSSFPSNSAAVAFAAAGGVWLISRGQASPCSVSPSHTAWPASTEASTTRWTSSAARSSAWSRSPWRVDSGA